MKTSNRILAGVLVLAAALTLTGCGTTETTVETTPESTPAATTAAPSPTQTPTPSPTPIPSDDSWNSLTGTYTLDPDRAGLRPVGVMFSNISTALPQYGIGEADLMYEMVVEAGITRIMALYADAATIPEIGSIRSTRNSYVDIAMGHDALVVHFGASILCWDYMAELGIQTLDWQFFRDGYWRDPDIAAAKGAEHSVKSNAELILGAIEAKAMRDTLSETTQPAFDFRKPDQAKPADGDACSYFSVQFTPSGISPLAEFEYDADSQTYIKSQFGDLHIDGHTGDPLRLTNVLVLFTEIYPLDRFGHVAARLEGGGSGYYLSGGHIQEINWIKPSLYENIQYTDSEGQILKVNAGKTYVCLVTDLQAGTETIN